MCDQKAGSFRCEMGTRVALRVFFVRDGRFIFNSYKDSLVRTERLLPARRTWALKPLAVLVHKFLFCWHLPFQTWHSAQGKKLEGRHDPHVTSELENQLGKQRHQKKNVRT